MAESATIPISRRTGEDRIKRGSESYRRMDLDRPILTMDMLFSTLGTSYGSSPKFVRGVRVHQYPNNTPTNIAARIVQETGHVAIADIGCGTGNAVRSWGDKVLTVTRCGLARMSMTGVSLHDFRGESIHPGTNQVFRRKNPSIRYVVGDARNMTEIEDSSQDVVLAHNSLRFASDPEVWLGEMLRIGRPGGSILFNSEFEQAQIGEPLSNLLDAMHDNGLNILKSNFIRPDDMSAGAQSPTYQLFFGQTENMVLCRIDIPSTGQALVRPESGLSLP